MSGAASPATSTKSAGSKTPPAVPIAGAVMVALALLTLCSAGLYLVKPEGAIGGDTLGPVFEVGTARKAYYLSLLFWLALCLLEAVAGALLLGGKRAGRIVALVWAWSSLGAFAAMALINVLVVLPALDQAGLESWELIRTLSVGPLAGCCPVMTGFALLIVLYHPSVSGWANAPAASAGL